MSFRLAQRVRNQVKVKLIIAEIEAWTLSGFAINFQIISPAIIENRVGVLSIRWINETAVFDGGRSNEKSFRLLFCLLQGISIAFHVYASLGNIEALILSCTVFTRNRILGICFFTLLRLRIIHPLGSYLNIPWIRNLLANGSWIGSIYSGQILPLWIIIKQSLYFVFIPKFFKPILQNKYN